MIIAALMCICSVALAQKAGNCTYVPTLDTPQHTLKKLSITFEDYKSIELADAETAIIYAYLTSLEKKHGNNSSAAIQYFAYSDNMNVSGNTLTFYPEAYKASSGSSSLGKKNAPKKAWGQDTKDYLRIAFPKGMLKATNKNGTTVSLDSISYKYEYTETDTDSGSDPLVYVLTPANGETVKSLSSVTLEFPNCTGTLVLNWYQTQEPYVIDENGNTVVTATRSFDTNAKFTGLIALKSSIKKAGTYTLVIPAESYYVTTSADGGGDKFYHKEIRATYTVLGESRNWESIPEDGSTVATFDGIHITFPGKTIKSKNNNVGNGSLKVYDKADDKYPAMEFGYFYAKTEGGTVNFTTASQISKVKENTTYYLDLPYGLLTFSDGKQNEGLHLEFTYSTTVPETPGTPDNPDPGTPDNPDPGTPDNPDPGIPDNPDPGIPDNPDPGIPDNPDPGTPDNPDPGIPDNPDPSTPDNPDPDTPENPETPEDPSGLVTIDNYVGYTTGEVYRKDGVRFNSGSEQGMLIYLPIEKTSLLAGATIKAIRTATGTTQLDTPRLVIIEGDDVYQTPVIEQSTSKFTTSMKDYALDTPYTITGDKALYVGIKCSLSADYHPMLFDETLDLPANLAWALTNNGWEDISNRGYGAPNIQILLDKNINAADIMVKPFQTSTYNKVGNDMVIKTQIFNYGMKEINSFDLTYRIGDNDAVVKSISDISLAQGQTYDVTINDAAIISSGRLDLSVEVTNVNGEDDAEPIDNHQNSKTFVYPQDMKKKILFEEFTGQDCVNCPSGTATVENVLADYKGQYVEVYHHAGYQDDNFTTREDYEYTWFYNGGTYAPGGMANRHPALPSLTSVVVKSNNLASVQSAVKSAMQMAPYVGINMQNSYDSDSRHGTVSIDLTCYEEPTELEHRLNVWLVQDSIMRYQNGSGVIMHNNAFRMSLTGIWGNAIQLYEGETQTLTFDYTIPTSIVGEYAANFMSGGGAVENVDDKTIYAIANNMRIVAFVADNSDNVLKCTVWNAEECIVTDVPDGIVEVRVQDDENATIYDLQGRAVKSPRRGLYISNGKTFIKR